jgi:hypothetical protein
MTKTAHIVWRDGTLESIPNFNSMDTGEGVYTLHWVRNPKTKINNAYIIPIDMVRSITIDTEEE